MAKKKQNYLFIGEPVPLTFFSGIVAADFATTLPFILNVITGTFALE